MTMLRDTLKASFLLVLIIKTAYSQDCGSIPPSAVTAGSASTPTNTTYLSTADVICDTGYTTTTLLIECLASGLWSQAVCDIVDCFDLTNPLNGVVSYDQTTYQAVAIYTCNNGSTINGTDENTDFRTCTESGTWSDDPPTCLVEDDDECCDGDTVIVRTMIFVVLLMVAAIILVLSW